MTSQIGQQIITIRIIPNTSRSKGNQEVKLKYNVKNVFLQKSCRKRGNETSSRPPFVF